MGSGAGSWGCCSCLVGLVCQSGQSGQSGLSGLSGLSRDGAWFSWWVRWVANLVPPFPFPPARVFLAAKGPVMMTVTVLYHPRRCWPHPHGSLGPPRGRDLSDRDATGIHSWTGDIGLHGLIRTYMDDITTSDTTPTRARRHRSLPFSHTRTHGTRPNDAHCLLLSFPPCHAMPCLSICLSLPLLASLPLYLTNCRSSGPCTQPRLALPPPQPREGYAPDAAATPLQAMPGCFWCA